jgi:hypothetical protein
LLEESDGNPFDDRDEIRIVRRVRSDSAAHTLPNYIIGRKEFLLS